MKWIRSLYFHIPTLFFNVEYKMNQILFLIRIYKKMPITRHPSLRRRRNWEPIRHFPDWIAGSYRSDNFFSFFIDAWWSRGFSVAICRFRLLVAASRWAFLDDDGPSDACIQSHKIDKLHHAFVYILVIQSWKKRKLEERGFQVKTCNRIYLENQQSDEHSWKPSIVHTR